MIYEIKPKQDLNGQAAPWPAGAGKNMIGPENVGATNRYIRYSNGKTVTPVTPGDSWRSTAYIPVTPGDVLFFGQINALSSVAGMAFYSTAAESDYISGVSTDTLAAANNIVTVPAGAYYLRHSFRINAGYNPDWEHSVYIIHNDDPHVWTPYSNICPISGYTIPGIEGTIYGGELDSNSGAMLSALSIVDLGDLDWTLDDGVFISDTAPAGIAAPASASEALAGVISTMYPNTDATSAASTPYTLAIDTSKSVIVNDPRYATAEAFKAAMDGVLMVYPLATPVELQLSQEQINILLAQIGQARNFGSRTNMLNTWMKLAQGYPVPEEELHMLRPTMSLPHDVVLRPTFEDTPLPIVDPPAAEPEENITESEES